jgi:hypothetical protein
MDYRQPLLYRLVSRVAEKPRKDIEETYRGVVNRLRRHSAESVVEQALAMLWNPPGAKLDELRTAPWLTLLLVKWALQDRTVALRVGNSISQQELDQLRQQLWDVPALNKGRAESKNIHLMLRSLIYVQVEFQRRENWGFMRWPALYAKLQPEHACRRQFRLSMGMEPDAYIDLTFALFAAVIDRKMPLSANYFAPLRAHYGEAVDRVVSLFVRDLIELREDLQSDAAYRIRGHHELYEFPYLKRFPLVRLKDGSIHCWHPLVFARGLEDAVHLRLSDDYGEDYTQSFSRVFEDYVKELAQESGLDVLVEERYKEAIGHDAPAVEAVIVGQGCNILVEAKMSLFGDEVLLQDNQETIFFKTKRVRDGIKQGWKVGKVLRSTPAAFGSRFDVEQDYMMVVTNRELLLGGGEFLRRLYSQGVFEYPDDEAQRRMPLTNVFILSIEDFERLMTCVAVGEVNLTNVLRDAALANQDPTTARMFFTDFLREHAKNFPLPSLLENARDSSFRRVEAILKS